MRNRCWFRSLGVTFRNSLLYAPCVMLRFNWLGSGMELSIARPFLLIRFAGMMFPGNGAFVNGSRTAISAPPGLSDCEKSPSFSCAVGSVVRAGVAGAEVLGLLSKL